MIPETKVPFWARRSFAIVPLAIILAIFGFLILRLVDLEARCDELNRVLHDAKE